MEEFSKHEKFMIRIHTVFIMSSMVEHVSDTVANDTFVNFVLPLAKDPVPNIRFNVAKLSMTIWPKLNADSRSKTEDMIRDVADTDKDFDAKYFAGKALETMRE
jgi:serine/threonine-protein phosphatase 2A regulatory subunit A